MRSEWREKREASDNAYKKRLITSFFGLLFLILIFYYKSVNYTPSGKSALSSGGIISYHISDKPTSSSGIEKEATLPAKDRSLIRRGIAEDYRFWLDRKKEARRAGDKVRLKQAESNIKGLIDRIMKLPESDIKFIQELVGKEAFVSP
ncbi:MAG: hypothetical protein ACE5GM_06415 [bacterium]